MWRMIFLAGVSVAALASTAAEATSFVFTGGVQTYNVSTTGLYVLRAAGAQGGRSDDDGWDTYLGGRGALVSGRFSLTSGTILNVVVGGQGSSSVTRRGGGGGGGRDSDNGGNSSPAGEYSTGMGGSGGSGGEGGIYSGAGGGGGGFFGNGQGGTFSGFGGSGGGNFSGGNGSVNFGGGGGGFGGGGGGGFGGGGGGGFSGGGASSAGGGGGGSFLTDAATNVLMQAGVNNGDGYASIELFRAAVPEPSSWAMLMFGFGGIGAVLRRRRLRTA